MAIKESKSAINFVIDKDKKEKLQKLAEADGRSLSSLVNKIVIDYLADKEKK